MTTPTAIRIYNNFSAGKTRISHGTTDHKTACWIDINISIIPRNTHVPKHRFNHVLNHVVSDDIHVFNLGSMLRRDDNGRDLNRPVVLISNGYLCLSVRA